MKEPIRRNLSGIYFREANADGKYENIVFEELSEDKQDDILQKYTVDQLINLVKILAKTIVEVGEYADIAKE
jgi:hypothetical protein